MAGKAQIQLGLSRSREQLCQMVGEILKNIAVDAKILGGVQSGGGAVIFLAARKLRNRETGLK